jgi:hypothetical protein
VPGFQETPGDVLEIAFNVSTSYEASTSHPSQWTLWALFLVLVGIVCPSAQFYRTFTLNPSYQHVSECPEWAAPEFIKSAAFRQDTDVFPRCSFWSTTILASTA